MLKQAFHALACSLILIAFVLCALECLLCDSFVCCVLNTLPAGTAVQEVLECYPCVDLAES